MAPPANLVAIQRKIQSGPLPSGPEGLPGQTNPVPLPDALKSGIEGLSGMSMADVRVHYNSEKPYEVQAKAFTQGTTIHVAPGQEENVPHEAWHVVQQKQGRVRPSMQMEGVGINDDAKLEREAEEMGPKAARGERSGGNAESVESENAAQIGEISAAPATSAMQRMKLAPGEGIYERIFTWVPVSHGKWVRKPTWVRTGTKGMDPRQLPVLPRYATEHIHNISRVPPEQQGRFTDGRGIQRHLSTRHIQDPAERAPLTRSISSVGRLTNSNGQPYSTMGSRTEMWLQPQAEPPLGLANYVMAPNQDLLTADPNEMSHDLVMMARGYGNWHQDMRTSEEAFAALPTEMTAWHHSSFLAGADVYGAGEIGTNEEGQLRSLSNSSGHYHPDHDSLLNVMDRLQARGANLDLARIQDMRSPGPAHLGVAYSAARGDLNFLEQNATRRAAVATSIKRFGQGGFGALRAQDYMRRVYDIVYRKDGNYGCEENLRELETPLIRAIAANEHVPFSTANAVAAAEYFIQVMDFDRELLPDRWQGLFQPNGPLAYLAPYYQQQ